MSTGLHVGSTGRARRGLEDLIRFCTTSNGHQTPTLTSSPLTHASMRPSTSAVRRTGAAVTAAAAPRGVQHRTFLGLFGRKKKADSKDSPFQPQSKQILAQDNLFHPLSKSPFPVLRARAERIKKLAPCPVHLRKGQRVLVNFECPDCGWPTHYSEKEWREDTEHGKYVGRLREANEDEHDLRSGREMTEFRLPGKSFARPTSSIDSAS